MVSCSVSLCGVAYQFFFARLTRQLLLTALFFFGFWCRGDTELIETEALKNNNKILLYNYFRYLGYFRTKCYSILGMEEKVTIFIFGTSCPFCPGDRLYRLRDNRFNRFTCNGCSCKENPKRFKDDFPILHYVSLEIPANKAARDLSFGSTTVRGT